MVGSMRSGDSPSASGNNGGLGGPSSNNSGNSSSSSKGSSPSSGGNNSGLGGPTSNNSGSSKSSSSKGSASSPSSSGSNGGLGGPTSNNSGNKGSSGSSSNANGGGNSGGQVGGGLNSGGNRASGAGPGASSNTSTTGGGFGSANSSIGGMNSPRGMNSSLGGTSTNNASPTFGGLNSPAGLNNSTLGTGMASFNASQDRARQADLAQQARTAETTSMTDMSREQALGTISAAEVGKKDPYNTLSGGLIGDITGMTVRQAVDFAKTAWDGKIANVVGAFQMKSSTLNEVAAKMGLLDAKMTPAVQDQLAVGLMQQRANLATVNGEIDVDKFAKQLSQEWASLATVAGQSYYNKNGIDKASVSYAKTRSMAESLIANGVVSAGKAVSSITSKDVSPVETKAPGLSRFNSTYMGAKTAPQKSAATSQQNDPSGLPSGTYPGHVVGDGIAPSFGTPTKQAAAAPAPTPTPAPERPRSLTEKVAAAGIDIGLGMVPGIGMGVSLVNGGLALTGNKTLGERIAGSIATGEGAGTGPDSGADRAGGGRDQVVKNTSTVPKETESFESRYIAFVDPTQRPTPAQKWNYDTPGYA